MTLHLKGTWRAKVRVFGIDLWSKSGKVDQSIRMTGLTEYRLPVGPVVLSITRGPTGTDLNVDAFLGPVKIGSKLIRSGIKDTPFVANWRGGEVRLTATVAT